VARNLAAALDGRAKRPFRFSTLGQLATIGRRTGVANLLGINFSGFIAWWLWRTIYLMKLPRLEKKIRVALGWTLDLVFTKDIIRHHRLVSLSPDGAAGRSDSLPETTTGSRPPSIRPDEIVGKSCNSSRFTSSKKPGGSEQNLQELGPPEREQAWL
jgi:hypothetical protein